MPERGLPRRLSTMWDWLSWWPGLLGSQVLHDNDAHSHIFIYKLKLNCLIIRMAWNHCDQGVWLFDDDSRPQDTERGWHQRWVPANLHWGWGQICPFGLRRIWLTFISLSFFHLATTNYKDCLHLWLCHRISNLLTLNLKTGEARPWVHLLHMEYKKRMFLLHLRGKRMFNTGLWLDDNAGQIVPDNTLWS